MSRWQTFCDAVLLDLMTNVDGLSDALPHRLAPWDPEQGLAEEGDKHLAVFPAAEAAEAATPIVTAPGGDLLVELYRVLYWENAGGESSRGLTDDEAAVALFDLAEATIARFYDIDNVFLGGTELTRFVGLDLPDRSGQTRWFQITLQARTALVLS